MSIAFQASPPTHSRHDSVHRRRRARLAYTAACTAAFLLPCWTSLTAAHENDAVVHSAIATVTASELREHAGLLADDTLEGREAGSRGGRAAARYLVEQLRSAGLEPAGENGLFVQRFYDNMQNLLAKIPGADPQLASQCIFIGAHYDHVGYGSRSNSNGPIGYIHNGADDNASGVATLLEIVEGLTVSGFRPRRTIVFALWDGEEKNLLGSRHWVRRPTVPLESLQLAINMDMVGRLRNGNLQVGGSRTGSGIRRLFSTRNMPEGLRLDFTWDYEGNSDHWSFYERQLPSVFIHTGLHDDYHRPSDDIERLNPEGMQTVAAYLIDVICRAADADQLPTFRPAARTETTASQRRREAPLPKPAPRLGATWQYVADENPPPFRIVSVVLGSPAAAAGLMPGDQIVSIDGLSLTSRDLLPAVVQRAAQQVVLRVEREGDEAPQEIIVQLAGSPSQLGLAWRHDPAEPGSAMVTRVLDFSPAARAGIDVHDRIIGFEGEPLARQGDLLSRVRQRLQQGVERLVLDVETRGAVRTVDVDLRLPVQPSDDSQL